MSGRLLERAKGIEPSYAAWEAAVLSLTRSLSTPRRFLFIGSPH